nr:uncharacterized protein LOC110140822 [Odocoileus virginianus texanus]
MAGTKVAPWLQCPQPASWKPFSGSRHAPGEAWPLLVPRFQEGPGSLEVLLQSWRGVWPGGCRPHGKDTLAHQKLQMQTEYFNTMNNSVSGTGTSCVAIFLLDFVITLKALLQVVTTGVRQHGSTRRPWGEFPRCTSSPCSVSDPTHHQRPPPPSTGRRDQAGDPPQDTPSEARLSASCVPQGPKLPALGAGPSALIYPELKPPVVPVTAWSTAAPGAVLVGAVEEGRRGCASAVKRRSSGARESWGGWPSRQHTAGRPGPAQMGRFFTS